MFRGTVRSLYASRYHPSYSSFHLMTGHWHLCQSRLTESLIMHGRYRPPTTLAAYACLPHFPYSRGFPQSTPSSTVCTHIAWRHVMTAWAARITLLALHRPDALSPSSAKPWPYPIPIPTLFSIPTASRAPYGTYFDWFPSSQQIVHPKTVIVSTSLSSQSWRASHLELTKQTGNEPDAM
jgi:hypothetical protein